MAPSDANEIVRALAPVMAARPEVLEAYLFGSRARGTVGPESDIDVAVRIDAAHAVPASEQARGYAASLAADIAAVLRDGRIDVVVLNDAPPLLYHRVLRDGIRIVSRDLVATTRREGQALSRWCDYVPQVRKVDAALARRIRSGAFGR